MNNEEMNIDEEVVEEGTTFDIKRNAEEQEECPECGKPLDECECEKEDKEEEFAQEEKCPNCEKPLDECECEENKEEEFAQEEVIGEAVSEEIVEEKLYSQTELDLAIEKAKAEFTNAMVELESLREFKAEYDRQLALQELNDKMDKIVVNFNVNEDLINELKEKVINGEYSLEKFELELYRNNTPMKKEYKKEEKQTKLPIIDSEEKMSDVDKFFAKYNVPKRK